MPALKPYTVPTVSDLGAIADGTAWFGSNASHDVLIGPNGQVVLVGQSGSSDACVTPDGSIGRASCEGQP
ncbi:MAG: hypothetical protein ACK41D_00660 [Rubricoccaceae bacterium]